MAALSAGSLRRVHRTFTDYPAPHVPCCLPVLILAHRPADAAGDVRAAAGPGAAGAGGPRVPGVRFNAADYRRGAAVGRLPLLAPGGDDLDVSVGLDPAERRGRAVKRDHRLLGDPELLDVRALRRLV